MLKRKGVKEGFGKREKRGDVFKTRQTWKNIPSKRWKVLKDSLKELRSQSTWKD